MTQQDQEQLRLLSIFHYVVGAMQCLFGTFPLIHVAIGLFFMTSPPHGRNGLPDEGAKFFGAFVVIGGLLVLMMWSLGISLIVAGRKLAAHRNYMFCFVVACIACVFPPFGTVLGVFTIIVLSRESVKADFQSPPIDPRDHFG